jgi:hypothetical protein
MKTVQPGDKIPSADHQDNYVRDARGQVVTRKGTAVFEDTDALLAAAASAPKDEDLVSVRALAMQYVLQLKQIARLEEDLAASKELARDISERQLPERMQAIGLPGLKLPGGASLDVKPFCACSIPPEKRERAYAWLNEIGSGDLIKHEVVASFGRGEDEAAKELYESLRATGLPVEDKRSVNFQSLNAVLRRRLEEGVDNALDPTALDVYAGTHAKLKVPKGVSLEEILHG